MRSPKKFLQSSVLVAVLVCGGAFSSHAEEVSLKPDAMKLLSERKDVTKFVELIKDAGLKDFFSSKDQDLTVFAPSDEAMNKAPSDVMKRAKADKDHLVSFVKYHTITGSQVFQGNVRGRIAGPSTGNGEGVTFNGVKQEPKVNDATFVTPDLVASNGVVHVMSKILIPPSIAQSDEEKEKARQAEVDAMKKREDEMMKKQEEMQAKQTKASEAKASEAKAKAPETKAPESTTGSAPSTSEVKPTPTRKFNGFLKMLGL